MGCVGSKVDLDRRNVFRVVNLRDGQEEIGQLEVTSANLTFYRKRKAVITQWPLQCLRRYGFDNETFIFEAGRRCQSGEGIYSFRCVRADALFNLLQEYIQESTYNNNNMVVSLDEDGQQQAQERMEAEVAELRRGLHQHPSAGGGSNYIILHGNGGTITQSPTSPVISQDGANENYLEPLRGGGGDGVAAATGTDPTTTTTSSNIYTNSIMITGLQPATGAGNLYQQLALAQSSPVTPSSDKNTVSSPVGNPTEEVESPTVSTPLSQAQNTYMNVTPGELSLMAMATTASNVNGNTAAWRYTRMNSNASVGCYENLDVTPQTANSINWRPDIFSTIELPALSEPCTPTVGPASLRKVNYIVLDLDNQSASSSSASGSTTVGANAVSCGGGGNSNLQTPESPGKRAGYATIDFNKTVALSNSTTAAGRRDLK